MNEQHQTTSQEMFDKADRFTRSYVVAALTLMDDEEPNLPENFEIIPRNIAPESMRRMIADCAEFQRRHGDVIYEALEPRRAARSEHSAEELAGNDFWLTRCGAGAGFWDGDWIEPHARAMDETSREFGNQDMIVGDDGLIYAEGGLVLGASMSPSPR